jgi:hypothetical protein
LILQFVNISGVNSSWIVVPAIVPGVSSLPTLKPQFMPDFSIEIKRGDTKPPCELNER